MSNRPVYLQGVSTALPKNGMAQDDVLDFMIRHLGDTPKKQSFLKRLYKATSIERRFSVLADFKSAPQEYQFFSPTEDLNPQPTTAARNQIFSREAGPLALKAVKSLLEQLPAVDAGAITHLITVSCTGFSAPGFDFILARDLPLSPAIHRFNLGFMGCFAAFPALKLATHICQSDPLARVLIVNVELCTLHFQTGFELDQVVANSLFADGVSASLVSSHEGDSFGSAFGGRRARLHRFASAIVAGSEDNMAWMIGDHGFDMKLSAYVPQSISLNIKDINAALFKDSGWLFSEVSLWAVHPGGRAILDRLVESFGVKPADFAFSYETLKNYGNMSSATVFFVLREIFLSGQTGKLYSAAFGPGLTVESALMEVETAEASR